MGVTLREVTDLPDHVTPGAPVEAVWGNEVVDALTNAVNTLLSLLPVGVMAMYGGNLAPPNWLFCHGAAVSTTTYSGLYAVIGDRYNQGQPATPAGTFRVPNFQARFPVGVNVGSSSGLGTFWSTGVGEVGGSYVAQMPVHQHGPHYHTLDLSHDHDSGNDTLSFLYRADRYNGDGNTLPWPSTPNTGEQMAWRERTGVNPPAVPYRSTHPSYSGLAGDDTPQVPPGAAVHFIIRAL